MARTGYLVIIYQDINPSSPTYNQTREERTQDEENCPSSAEAHWIEDTKYCELTENGMLTGYEITVYRDVEPLSSTYNQTREERELNPTECEANEYTPNWQNIGEPFCRQMVYLPGGLMGNDGYMIQQQQDMNEYSETADEIREIETLDLENCPLPNTEPVWQIISESCHLVMYQGELVYDGTKDVIRVNTNQYSPTWNNNIPETANIQDPINCPTEIEIQYRWITVSGETVCVEYDKYSLLKKQQSTDGGQTWTDVSPLDTMTGYLIEANSEDCGYVPPTPPSTQYRWVTVSESYQCIGYDKYSVQKKQQSTDGGETWTDVSPLETRAGELVEVNSEDCGYVPSTQYRWVVVSGQYTCVGYDKHSVEKKQESTDGGETWTDVTPLDTRTGSVIEYNSEDCGYVPPTPTTQYRWITISGQYECVGYDKHSVEKKQQSIDGGQTWTDVSPSETRTGELIEANSEYCGYVPPTPTQYRWVVVSGEYMCVGYDKHTKEKKQQSIDGGQTWTDVSPTETRAGQLVEANSQYCGYVPPTDYSTQYLTFVALENGTFGISNFYYSRDNGATWNTRSTIDVTTGDRIMLKGNNLGTGGVNFRSTGRFNVEGNIMSLQYGDNFIGQTTLHEGIFKRMFSTDGYGHYAFVVSAENLILPPTTAPFCYSDMFYYCTTLEVAPALPATTLASNCYEHMFASCTSLTRAPELPALTLANACYFSMFADCQSLNYVKAMFLTAPSDCNNEGTEDTIDWLFNVSPTGTFVKNSNATWPDNRCPSAIPSGWTIQHA